MKHAIISVLLFLINTLSLAQIPNLHIYYLNGIATTGAENFDSASTLQNALSSLTGNVKVDGIYNPMGSLAGSDPVHGCMVWDASQSRLIPQSMLMSGSVAGSTPAFTTQSPLSRGASCYLSDFGEVGASKINEETFYDSFAQHLIVGNNSQNYSPAMQAVAQSLSNKMSQSEKGIVVTMAKIVEYAIAKSVNNGNKVLLVTHSQGNLIANLGWIRLAAILPQAKLKDIRILNVGNASRFSIHGEDVSHNNDRVIFNALPALGLVNPRNTVSCVGSIEVGGTGKCLFKNAAPTYTSSYFDKLDLSIDHDFIDKYLSDELVTQNSSGQRLSFKQAVVASADRLLRGMGAIPNALPVARFTSNVTSAIVGSAISFNASTSTDADGSIASYAWSFGDGATATGVNASRAYSSAGSYTVTLTVTDNAGASASTTRNVTITPAPQPDLMPSALNVSPGSVQPGAVVNASWTITNSGNGNALASQTGIRLLPASTAGFGSSANNLVNVPTGPLAAGGAVDQNQAITIPANTAPGSYVIVVVSDNTSPSELGQSNLSNDFARSAPFNVVSAPTMLGFAFQDDFSGTALDSAKWTVEGFDGNLATYTQSNGYLNITVPGGSRGVLGIADGAKFRPKVAPITGDFEFTLSAEEISRTSRGGSNALSNVQLLMTGASAELGIYIVGDYINNQGIRGHQIIAYYRNGNSVVLPMTKVLTVGQYYAFQFRIRRSAGLSFIAYKLSGDANWTETAVPASFPANAVSVPSIVIFSGDGGNTATNGSFQARFDSVTIGQ